MEATSENIKKDADRKKDVFQKEIIYNKILPYSSELQEEANAMLQNIKTNLSICVSNCEIRPGFEIWMKRLKKYILYYGLRFSKEDHVAFIHLFYESLLIPYLEPYLFGECARLLRKLLKKVELLSPLELVLEWKPLYNVCKNILFCSKVDIGMYGYSSNLEEEFILVIHEARYYFSKTATQEMLNEWMPLLCPLDSTSFDNAIRLMAYFFPMVSQLFVEYGYKLWFENIMNLWEVCNSCSIWDSHIMDLLSFVAENAIGYIDWEPYIPVMFNRFLSCFQLPVTYKNSSVSERYHWDVTSAACWIVSVLGGGSKTQQYLDNLMSSLESYFHPVNSGRWTSYLSKFLQGLTFHFIKRLHYERYQKLTWETPVPEDKKLSESDIDVFVLSLKSVALQSMLCEAGEVKTSIQILATLRPTLIGTDIIEHFYMSLQAATNPTKYKAVLQCLTVVIRPLLDSQCPISAGASHIIPLLWAVLPGIDPNDWDKSITSLQFVDTVISMVPVVDCSKAPELHPNLTDDEIALCLETANFENLILEFFDHCFLLISSSSSLDSTRLEQGADKQSKFENSAQESLLTTCSTVLRQTSTPIFKAALTKLHYFVRNNILETKVAGRLLAGIMQSFVQTNAEVTLQLFIPFLSNHILHSSSMEDILTNFTPSSEFLFYLQLTSKIVNCPGKYLLPHVSVLNDVLKKCLQIQSREGFTMASTLLHDLIRSLLSTVPLEYHSVSYSLDEPFKDSIPIKDWGRAGDINNLNLNFFVPGDDEIKCVQLLIHTHLPPQMELIEKLVNSSSPRIDEKLEFCLEAITALLECRSLLPDWDDDELHVMDSCLKDSYKPPRSFKLKKQPLEKDSVISSLRKVLVDLLEKLQALLLTLKEYGTKSLIVLSKIWSLLLNNNHFNKLKHEIRFKNYRMLKKMLENQLLGQKKHLRFLLITRVQLQHELLQDREFPCFTSTHRRIMLNLLTLSTSNYSDVRREARIKLFLVLDKFPHSYRVLIPSLCGYLSKDAIVEYGMFEGALRILLGPSNYPILVRHDWDTLQSIWPILLRAKPEKESILSLFDLVEEIVEDDFGTPTITSGITKSCVDFALLLGKDTNVKDGTDIQKKEELNTEKNKRQYFLLLNTIVNIVQNENLHCRFECLAMNFLMALVHPVVRFPSEVVKCFLEFLINDSLELRKFAVVSVVMVFKQQKSVHKKIELDPYGFIGMEKPAAVYPGDRPDNQWIKYKSKNIPRSEEDWYKTHFLHRESQGYYCWPNVVSVYAPANEQPPFKAPSALTDEEKEVRKFFTDSSRIDRLLSFFTLEEKKGEDKFCEDRFLLFKGLFRNFGFEFFEIFVPHLQKFVKSPQESYQRCAAEIMSGAMRGSKHWPYEMLQKAWKSLSPLVRDALQHINEDTVHDWKACFALASENRDPRWNHWLFEVLMEDAGQPNSSFIEAKRIHCIETALAFHLWKLSDLLTSWLEVLKKRLSHNFQNVRNHVGEALCRIFEADFTFPKGNPPNCPRIKKFISHISPPILKLYETASKEGQMLDLKQSEKGSEKPQLTSDHVLEIRLLKTVCVWISTMIDKCAFGISSDFYHIFPTLCLMENYKSDSELKQLCANTLGKMARSTHLSRHLNQALEAIKKASQCTSWQSRVSCTEFLQVFVFYNMPIILSNSHLSDEVRKLVLELLEDKCLEVREKSSEVLCGLLHTGFINDQMALLNIFKRKIEKLRRQKQESGEQISLRLRHTALLGLCAFIDAHPYDVPDFIPDLFVILQKHLSDPHPIPVTIRKTICNFQRTHHDNWSHYKHKFNEDQLSILADLTTGPTYYA